MNGLIQARLNDLMAFSALTGAAVAHSLGLDPELAMEVGKRQAKENCVKVLASMCLTQYGRYLAAGAAGAAAVGAGLEAQKHIAQALKKDDSGSGGSSSSSSKDSGKNPSPEPGNHGGGDGDGNGNGNGNGPKLASGMGGLGVGKSLKTQKKELIPGEGEVGTYRSLRSGRGTADTAAHHIPNKQYMATKGVKPNDGISMRVEHSLKEIGGRHREIHKTMQRQDPHMAPRDALAQSVNRAREVYRNDGVYTDKIREGLQEVISKNKETFPNLFNKN